MAMVSHYGYPREILFVNKNQQVHYPAVFIDEAIVNTDNMEFGVKKTGVFFANNWTPGSYRKVAILVSISKKKVYSHFLKIYLYNFP